MIKYDEDYYKQNNYVSYLERQEKYERLVHELHHDLFKKINLDKEILSGKILDFGCAVGFTVSSFQKLGYDIFGYDVSSWAIDYGIKNNILKSEKVICDKNEIYKNKWSLVIALDVLEHLTHEELFEFMNSIDSNMILVRIPVSKEENGRYILNISEYDKTHVIRWTSNKWDQEFQKCGYIKTFTLNLGSIYESSGVHCVMYKKPNLGNILA